MRGKAVGFFSISPSNQRLLVSNIKRQFFLFIIVDCRFIYIFVSFAVKMITNDTSSHLLWEDSISSLLALIGPIIALVSSTSCLIILNTYLKILNKIFKTLMNIVLIYNIISFSFTIAVHLYIVFNQSQTFLLCSMEMLANLSPTYVTIFGIGMMSFLRYHIARRIANLQSTREEQIMRFSKFV